VTLSRCLFAGVLALSLGACPKPAEPSRVVDAGAAPVAAPLKRPPFPNLATAAYGQRVLDERLGALPAGAPGTVEGALTELHDVAPGAEERAVTQALAAARAAPTDKVRAAALALAAAGLVLDPVVDGYKERLTDAFGIAAYAATLDQSDTVAQAARALVDAAAGAVEQARRIVKGIEDTPVKVTIPADARLLMALTRRVSGERGDALVADLAEVLKAKPQSLRAHALSAELYLELGLVDETLEAAEQPPPAPWLAALAGRARVLGGDVDGGIAALRDAQAKIDEGHRGDVLYWLGRSLTQKPDGAAEVQQIASSLSPRPGYAKESRVLVALLAQQAGDYARARSTIEPLTQGAPHQSVDVDALWLLADACAGLGDVACVDKVGHVVLAVDGDESRLQVARAAAVLVGKADAHGAGDVTEAFREAHRLAPFDDKLAAKVGEPVVAGGAQAAGRLRAARRALARGGAEQLVTVALAPVKDPACRACRALLAATTRDPQEGARRALKALDGAGPPLAESDLVRVLGALGGFALPEVKSALAKLEHDPRPRVQEAVARARADLQDPAARAARLGAPEPAHGSAP
jgi:hypothetical protein